MNLGLRILSSLVLLPVTIAALVLSQWTTLALVLVVAIFSFLEFGHMVAPEQAKLRIIFAPLSVIFCLLCMLAPQASTILLLYALLTLGLLAYFTFHPSLNAAVLEKMSMLLFGCSYIGIGVVSIFLLRKYPDGGLSFIFLAITVTASNDTFAYFAGRTFGRHQLFAAVSQKKTWEGFAGGAIATVLMPFVLSYVFSLFQIPFLQDLQTRDILWIALPAIVLSPLGDLFESRIKRAYHVKDSGHMIPGHGGFLDRVDALLVIVPWTLAYTSLIRPLW